MVEQDLNNKNNNQITNQTNDTNPQVGLNPNGTPAILEEKPKRKLSKGERKKLRVIKKLLLGEINGTEAAKKLGITTRQVRNLKRQVINEGTEGVVHKNKNYKPYNTYDTEISTFVCKLYRREYRGTNFSEFARICQEQYGIEASRSTIYNFLRRGRIRSPQRKMKKKKVVLLAEGESQITQTPTPKKRTKKATASKSTTQKRSTKATSDKL
jgi:hypothetical protein